MTVLLIILIIVHFVKDQFDFSAVTRLGYWIIPIFTLYQFIRTFAWSTLNVVTLAIIVIFASWVGRYQARHTRIQLEETATTYFRDAQQHEVPIYRKVVTAQGGRHYLYGWLMTLGAQFVIELTYLHEHLTLSKIGAEFFTEVLADLMSFYRFTGAARHTSWTLWALTGATSLAYTLWLTRKSPAVKRTLFGETKYRRVTDE